MGSDGTADQVILATAGYDHTIRFWQAHSGMCKRTVQHAESQVNALEITPDKQSIAAAGYQHIRMYDLNNVNPNPVINYEGISKNVSSVGFHEDGKWMFTGGEDCTARIWDLRFGLHTYSKVASIRSRNLQCQKIFQVLAPVNCVCLHPNQGEMVIGDQSGIIHVWDLRTNKNEQLIPEADTSVQDVDINSSGTLMAAVNSKGNCYVWTMIHGTNGELAQLMPKKKLQAHSKYALKCKFSPDSTYLVTTSADTTAKIWKTVDFTVFMELKEANQRWVWDVAFSADSQYIITASSDNMARLWSVETGSIKREYSGHQKAVTCLAFQDVSS